MLKVDDATKVELEAAAFRRLLAHLSARPDVQNIDLMTVAGFCRNCLSNWLEEAAAERGLALARPEVREHVYGMPQEEWKRRYQKEVTPAPAGASDEAAHPEHAAEQAAADAGEAAIPSPS